LRTAIHLLLTYIPTTLLNDMNDPGSLVTFVGPMHKHTPTNWISIGSAELALLKLATSRQTCV